MGEAAFDFYLHFFLLQPLIHAILKRVWTARTLERERIEANEALDSEAGAGTSKKSRPTSVNGNALKLSCELVRVFVTEAVQRAAAVAEAEGSTQIEPSHLEFILPQLLLDF
ncbi:protein MHF2 homolog isoform X1 [Arachis stenosperma]|uniref:protein MHF2 homolog isoform X1 n=1 Tax=Arachis stenosperma TaxID=217475 RepID=UPI0025ACF127|nr:protein MHF2 homolog isoform X1 [Arachis stenosperma]